jgi:hypothetical protein
MAAPAGASNDPGLRQLWHEAGLTQQSVADRAGVIRDLEHGMTRRPHVGSSRQEAPELDLEVGPLSVYQRGVPVPPGGSRQRALLELGRLVRSRTGLLASDDLVLPGECKVGASVRRHGARGGE